MQGSAQVSRKLSGRQRKQPLNWNQVIEGLELDKIPVFEILIEKEGGQASPRIKIFWDGRVEGVSGKSAIVNRLPTLLQHIPSGHIPNK
jgi:hypothetical protein